MKNMLSVVFMTLWVAGGSVMGQQVLEEHKMLKMDEGVWDAKITLWSGPDTEPIRSNAKETNTMIGALWSIGKLEGNIAGMDYVGHATLGYDPMQKKYVGTWIDSLTPVITHMSGTYDPKTKTLILYYTTYGQDGQEEKRKNVMVYKDEKTRDFIMYLKKGEEWTQAMEILYKRIE